MSSHGRSRLSLVPVAVLAMVLAVGVVALANPPVALDPRVTYR